MICQSLHNNSPLADIDRNLASAPFELFQNAVKGSRHEANRPSHALRQRQLTYQVIHLLSASGHEFPLCAG